MHFRHCTGNVDISSEVHSHAVSFLVPFARYPPVMRVDSKGNEFRSRSRSQFCMAVKAQGVLLVTNSCSAARYDYQ